MSLLNPKFGELIAFRNLFRKIENTSVDEEYIAMLIKSQGLRNIYVPDSIIYNFGPRTISDFLKQKRRIYCGHLKLKKKNNYGVSTLDNFQVFGILLKEINLGNIFHVIFSILIVSYGRLLGAYDYFTNKKHYIWEIAETTKKDEY
jgi:cellulose synthase/poly-beta-1,6-N-acetylglucosamine synthase-like glycosyltransferase